MTELIIHICLHFCAMLWALNWVGICDTVSFLHPSAINWIWWGVREVKILVYRYPLGQHEPWANWAQSHTSQCPKGTFPQWYWGGNVMKCCTGPWFTAGISAEEGLVNSRIGWGSSPPGKRGTVGQYSRERNGTSVQVLVLSQLHLWQAKEIKAQSEKIKYLFTLLERQQTILEKVQEQQTNLSQMPHPPSQLEELHKEAFEILPGTVNVRHGASIEHLSRLSQNILVAGKAFS